MPNKLIKDLIDKGAVTLKEQGYSIRSREYTLLTWKQFQEFCNKKGYETYLPSHKDEFITELGKCTPPLQPQSTTGFGMRYGIVELRIKDVDTVRGFMTFVIPLPFVLCKS